MLDPRTALDVFQFHAELGNAEGLRASLDEHSPAVKTSRSDQDLSDLDRYIRISDLMSKIEEIHGRGAAITLDHPINRIFASEGLIDEERLTAARRYLDHFRSASAD